MNKTEMRENMKPAVTELRAFQNKVNNLINVLERTTNPDISSDGTNKNAMESIKDMLEHDWLKTSKIRPVLNDVYKVLYANVAESIAEQRKEERDYLNSMKPKTGGRPKGTKNKPKNPVAENATNENASSADESPESVEPQTLPGDDSANAAE